MMPVVQKDKGAVVVDYSTEAQLLLDEEEVSSTSTPVRSKQEEEQGCEL